MTNWKKCQDWINTTGSVVAIIGAIVLAAGWTLNVMPFVRTDVYNNDMAQVRLEVGGLKTMTKDNTTALTAVNRNSLLNLELSLQSRVELLSGVLQALPRTTPTYGGFVKERDAAQQQLDETRRELNR